MTSTRRPPTVSALHRDVLCRLHAVARESGGELFLVGGFVRDYFLGRPHSRNVDLAVAGGALSFAQRAARELGGTYICLDEQTGCGRVVVPAHGDRLELDIADFRGPTLDADLGLRDFTINALAAPLAAWCEGDAWTARVVDPLGGRADIDERRVRACFPRTFEEDPVRILRAFRFAASLHCSFEPSLPSLMSSSVPQLARVAGERVRDELFAILETDQAGWACDQLAALGALDVMIPELKAGRGLEQGGYHHLDVLGHQLETVHQCDRLLADFAEFSPSLREHMVGYFSQMPVEGRSRKALLKLSGLLHDVGKPATKRVTETGDIWFIGHEQFGAALVETVTERLRLANREADLVHHLVLYHLRPGHLSREPQLTARAIFRFFRDLGEDGPACLMVWWADRLSTRGPSSRLDQIAQQRARLEELFAAYFLRPEEAVKPPKLVDGVQLMEGLGLPSGPRIGELLRAIEEAQAEGRVRTRDDALALARRLLQGNGPG